MKFPIVGHVKKKGWNYNKEKCIQATLESIKLVNKEKLEEVFTSKKI